MRFSIAQVLAMLENDDINGDEDVPMMPGSDDEFGSEGSGDELLDDIGAHRDLRRRQSGH
jgi:hypothetical protein